MKLHIPVVAAVLACAAPVAAQGVPRGPHLMQVAASSGGVVLSVDSSTVVRSGEQTFLADAVYQFPADTAQQVTADRQVDSQEIDCAGMRVRGRRTMYYLGESPVRSATTDSARPSRRWEAVSDDERPIAETLCRFLLGSFASIPITRELSAVEQAPELVNRRDVARELSRRYPPAAREAKAGGQAMLRFQITAEGQVDTSTMRVLWATRADFAAAALRVIRVMRFRPAKDHGEPVAVWAIVPVAFWNDGDEPDGHSVPERTPAESPVWGGRSATPTRPVHPNPSPVTPG